MSDWVVVVKQRGNPNRKRVFVENIEHEDEAKRLALLKLGVSSLDHETYAELIDERVSLEDPTHNTKELYEQALIDLTRAERKCQELYLLSSENLKRAEKAENERDHIIKSHTLALTDIELIRSTLDRIQTCLNTKPKG